MKKLVILTALVISLGSKAQVKSASLQANGLTCSMCSNAINKALKTLDFVSTIDADIKTYTFEISFKPGADIDFYLIKAKVENAGFTVSSLYVNLFFNNVNISGEQRVVIGNKTFLFINPKDQFLHGDRRIKIVDKGFVSEKEYKQNSYPVPSAQTYHVAL